MFSGAIILLVALVITRCSATALRSADPAAIESSLKASIEDLTSVKSARASHSMILKKMRSGGMSFGGTHRLSAQAVISSSSVPTGYAYTNSWSSSTSCSGNADAVSAYPLGVCFTSDGGNSNDDDKSVYFQIVTASGTSITRTYYTDATCTTACGTGQTCTHSPVIYTADSCSAVNSYSGKATYSTSLTYPSVTGYVNSFYFSSGCTSTVMGYSYIKSGFCSADGSISYGYTCSGTSYTYNLYSGTTCSGTATSSSTQTLTTTCTSMKGYNETSYENYDSSSCREVSTTDDSTTCFAGSESVQLENGSMKQISEVSVGDVVLSADSNLNMKYSPVIAVPHKTNDIETSFSNIRFVDERDIMMTPEHLILAGSCGSNALGLMAAKKVAPGMCAVDSENKQVEVVSNDMKTSKGLYTIVTNEEYVVINGFVASPFAYNHFVANNFYNVYRMAVKSMPLLFQSQFFMAGFHAFAGLVMSV